ncbi:Sec-independent protein translocase protein TatB [Desulfolutivibrio sp.]|uniref:Sec-independent protein translocase protein TatB n=1 Tax=Desulfolutivibrio sp. TaxID=2773296 RepID=UPI002F962FD0
MFGIGTTELLVILVVALIVIGPSKLPDVMRTIGKGLAEFRRVSTDVKSTLEAEVQRAEDTKRKEEAKKELFPENEAAAPETAAKAANADTPAETPAAPPAADKQTA